MIRFIDDFLSGISMYRLMLYYLSFLFGVAIILSFLRILPYNPFDILISGIYLIVLCYISNKILGHLFKIKLNHESQFITGFILSLIIGPLPLLPNILFLTVTPILAMTSKYGINIQKQHIFNPGAFAVVATAIFLAKGASWWIGSTAMAPLIILGGIILLRKIHRFDLILGFLISYAFFILIGSNQSFLPQVFFASPILFFSFVMLTEPLTSPADRNLRIYYGIFTALVFIILQKVTPFSYTLELSLLIANVAGRVLKVNTKYTLTLKQKKKIAPAIWEFFFEPLRPLQFIAGQSLQWSLPHKDIDNRGSRRFFTISSSPTEKEILLTVKIPEKPSSFKSALKDLSVGESVYATNLEGDFTQPKEKNKNYVFIAGGIGITPFRSIIKQLLDTDAQTRITLFYSARLLEEFVFKYIFSEAEKKIGLKTVYVVSEKPKGNWQGEVGHIDEQMINRYVQDTTSSFYYISGPQPMVLAIKKVLGDMGIQKSHIRTDYFPGYTVI